MAPGTLFRKEGRMYEKVFFPVLVLRKGCFSFENLCLLCPFYSAERIQDYIQIKKTVVVDKLEIYSIYALMNSFFSRQPISRSESVRYICCILPNLRKNCMHLFFVGCISFFSVKFGYQAKRA